MRIVITGAGGTLGRALWPLLAARGDDVTLFDVVDIASGEQPAENVRVLRGDVRVAADVSSAVEKAEIVVHTAAIHGIHLASHTAQDFYDLNVTGTFNVWQAAVAAKVKGVVFSSTMGVYGESRRPHGDDDAVQVTEDLPLQPGDVYGWSKVVGEEMCRYHWRADGIPSVALRYGMFVPEPFFRYGIRLLYGGVHEDDVARAVVASIDALADGRIGHEAFNVESAVPFEAADAHLLRHDRLAAVERHYPGARALLAERGVANLKSCTEWFSMQLIEERLGFRPQHNFDEWLAELARRPSERATASPPWP